MNHVMVVYLNMFPLDGCIHYQMRSNITQDDPLVLLPMITSSNPFPPTLPFEAFDLHSLMSSRPTSTARTGASSTTSRATASRATPSLAAQSSAARPGPDVRSALAQVGPVGTCSIMMAFQNIHRPLPHNHILDPGIHLRFRGCKFFQGPPPTTETNVFRRVIPCR